MGMVEMTTVDLVGDFQEAVDHHVVPARDHLRAQCRSLRASFDDHRRVLLLMTEEMMMKETTTKVEMIVFLCVGVGTLPREVLRQAQWARSRGLRVSLP